MDWRWKIISKETANVSTTTPLIQGVGTNTGYGIKIDGGALKYYDGKIIGNTNAMSNLASEVEYMYEVKTYTDSETGYKYCILEWMRSTN